MLLTALKVAKHTKVEQGRLLTPSGEEYVGFKVTIDDGLPPAKLDYERETVSKILHKTIEDQKIKEIRENGKFKAFIVSTD